MSLKGVWKTLLASAAFAVLFAGQANAQAVLTGRVLDADGAPVAFAEVAIERLNLATATEVDGTYRLLIPAARVSGQRETVVARALGYRSQTLEVTVTEGEMSLEFTLMLDPLRLEGVVATGQALSQTRERLGYTVDTVESEEILQSEENNIVAALAGKAPGVWVTSSAGDAGSGAFINIRGWNTLLTSNQPLFVVDGTPIDNSSFTTEGTTLAGTVTQNRAADINPEDIESIEILKGPAATSIYGSAGANGVILITTRQGQRGVTRFTGKASYSWDDVNKSADLQTQYGRGYDGAAIGEPGTNLGGPTTSVTWGPELPAGTVVYDHSNEIWQTGHQASLDLTLSGGGDRTTYFLSGSYLNHEGPIVGNNELNKWSMRLKATQWIRDNLSVSGNFAYTNQKGDLIQTGSNTSGLLLAAWRTVPEFNNLPYLDPETGLHRSYRVPEPTSLTSGRGYDNPFWVANEILNQTNVGRTFGNVRLDWQALDWLNASWIVGADYSNDDRFTLFPKSSSSQPLGRVWRANYRTLDIDNTILLTGEHTFNENISGSASLGWNLRQQDTDWIRTQGDNVIFGSEELDFAVDRIPNEFKSSIRNDGYFGELNVDLYNQLFLSARARNEGWSTFGPDADERFWYGSASASWTFTKALNLDPSHWFSFGKARIGYGSAGRAPNVYSNVAGFTTSVMGDGWLSNGLQSIYLGNEGVVHEQNLANTAIEPERTNEWEAGLELAFLNSRIAFTGVYYKRKTTDAIVNLPLPPSTGFGGLPSNAAEFENNGWEFILDLIPVQTDNFSWDVGFQWSTNDSEVLELCAARDAEGNCTLGSESIGLGGFFSGNNRVVKDLCGISAAEPCPFGIIWGEDFIRFGREDGTVVAGVNIDDTYEHTDGDLYIAADGFPVTDPQERVIGDPNPDWLGSMRNTFRIYRNLRVSFLIDRKQGGETWNGTEGALVYFGTAASSLKYHGEGTPHVFEGSGPGAGTEVQLNWDTWTLNGPGSGFTGPGSQFVEESSYTKLRDLSVTYAFDQPWVNRIGFNTVEVTLSGRNLKTWTDYTGIDPETNLRGQNIGRGLDYFNHPQTRSWILTFNFIR